MKQRGLELHKLDTAVRAEFAARLVGRELKTLVLKSESGYSAGLASNFQKVNVSGKHGAGTFLNVKITGAIAGLSLGEAAAKK